MLETFTSHQEQGESNNNYYKNFKPPMEMVKAHGGKPWILDLLRNRILGEFMLENGWTNISTLTEEEAKDLEAKTDGQAENEFVAGLFICWSDNGRYGEIKTCLSDNFSLGDDKSRVRSRQHSPC